MKAPVGVFLLTMLLVGCTAPAQLSTPSGTSPGRALVVDFHHVIVERSLSVACSRMSGARRLGMIPLGMQGHGS
jgi:hypothetical protein